MQQPSEGDSDTYAICFTDEATRWLVRRRTRLWRDNQIRDACAAFRRMCLDDIAAAEAHARRARVMARIASIWLQSGFFCSLARVFGCFCSQATQLEL